MLFPRRRMFESNQDSQFELNAVNKMQLPQNLYKKIAGEAIFQFYFVVSVGVLADGKKQSA
jgi:hypothetical protein